MFDDSIHQKEEKGTDYGFSKYNKKKKGFFE